MKGSNKSHSSQKINPVGGQALIEGVMMRSENYIGNAYRLPNGKIKTEKIKNNPWTKKYKWMNIIFIRGIFVLIEILILGTKILIKSSQYQEEKRKKK